MCTPNVSMTSDIKTCGALMSAPYKRFHLDCGYSFEGPFMSARITTPKQEVAELLSKLPDDSTFEDIQRHLYVLEKIKRGQADGTADQGATPEQARDRLKKWLQE